MPSVSNPSPAAPETAKAPDRVSPAGALALGTGQASGGAGLRVRVQAGTGLRVGIGIGAPPVDRALHLPPAHELQDAIGRDDHVLDPVRSKQINTVWPIGSVYFQPNKVLTVRADVESITNGRSYTRITPHTDVGGRFVVRLRPTDKFYIEDSAVVRNRRLLDTDYRSTIRSNAVTATYEFSDKLSGFGGFS